MRRTAALIVGGGPAGCAAAIRLAAGGTRPLLVERSEGPRDVVCGGFLGWDAIAALGRLGVDAAALGARPIRLLRLVGSGRTIEVPLPRAAAGLSRRTLDAALQAAAADAGAELLRGRVARAADPAGRVVRMEDGEEIAADALLLATGKHELRGVERGVPIAAAPVGLRATVDGGRGLAGVIELHLFDGGYAGLLLQEDGTANLCLSVSRVRLKQAGGIEALVEELSRELPALRVRLGEGPSTPWSAVAGIPYGWRGRTTSPGLYRMGDQAAVIASIAGDGIAIALESGIAAGDALLAGTAATDFQREFARRSARPVRLAEALRRSAERSTTRALLVGLFGLAPGLASKLARLTRIAG